MATYTYDLTTSVGKGRLLMPDRAIGASNTQGDAIYSDEEWTAFLDLESGSTRRAAAMALETAATDDLLVAKITKLGVLSIETDKTAAAMMERAKMLRTLDQQEEGSEGGGMEIAEWVLDPAGARHRVWNEALRMAGE